jgi:hypothetical protein
MENALNFDTPQGVNVQVSFSPEGDLLVSLATDTTPLKVTVQSPTKKDSQEWVGGMKKR